MLERLVRSSFLLALASACGAIAQTAPRLTLQDAETLALKNHPEIQAAENEVAYANQQIVIDRAAYYPFVTGEGRLAGSGRSTRCGSITIITRVVLAAS